MTDLDFTKNSWTPTGLVVVLVFLLFSACVSIDADFFIRITSLKAAWGSEDGILLPAEFLVPSSAKAKNCQESIDQLSPVLHRYFNKPEVKYCGTLTSRTITDENGNETKEYTLKKDEYISEHQMSPGSGERSYGVMAVSAVVPFTLVVPNLELFSFTAETSDSLVILRIYVNKALHQNLANEVQEFSNTRISVNDGDALLPHLGRFNIDLDNDSNAECRIEFEGRKNVLKPSEKERYRLNYTNDEVYGKDGFRALAIGGCLF